MSGGTLTALAADEIVMSSHAVLGPIDPQLEQSPAVSLIKVVEEKPLAKIEDQTLIMADVGRKAIAQVNSRQVSCWSGGCPLNKPPSWRNSSHPVPGRVTIRSGRRPRSGWASP
jgi:hypothetical protein